MGLLDHFRHGRSSSQPTPDSQPLQHGGPPPDPSPQHGQLPTPQNHHQPQQQAQYLAPPPPLAQPHQPHQPIALHLTFDGWSGKNARLISHQDPNSPTLYALSIHSRSPELRFTSAHGVPFASVDIHLAVSIDFSIHGLTFNVPPLGWNNWEYTYPSPAMGGRVVAWSTPEGHFGDTMHCVLADNGLPVCRWTGRGFAMGMGAGSLEVVSELAGQQLLVDELVVVTLGLWWMRYQTRNGAYV